MPEPVRLLLVRHGEQVRTGDDGPLTERGERQVRLLAAVLALGPDDLLVASPLRRARQTAAAFARPARVYDDLCEFRFGPSWRWEQADRREDLALWRPQDRVAGGESMAEFQTRIDAALAELAGTGAPRIVVCVHSGVIDAALRWAFGATAGTPWTTEAELPHASVTELWHWPTGRHPRGAPRHTLLVRLGDVGYLPAELVTDGPPPLLPVPLR